MKKLIVFLLIGLYMIPTFGITVSIHYCGGKINSISILELGSHKGCCGGKAMKMDCCKDKKISIKKASSEEQVTKIIQLKISDFSTIIKVPLFVNSNFNLFETTNEVLISNNDPPPDAKHPIYLMDRCIRI